MFFFCESYFTPEYKQAQLKRPLNRRNNQVKVTLPGFASKILVAAEKRGDALGQKLHDRISQLALMNTDLVAVNAEYHEQCLKNFYHLPRGGMKPGKP